MRRSSHRRGYALMIVLMVLALMSVGLGTLFYFLEASAATTGSMLERRRVFYACDGIGRGTTVLAQSYMSESAPTTAGLIKSVCTAGGGGCCPSATGAVADCDASNPPLASSTKTAFLVDPGLEAATTAMPNLVPAGFKLKEFRIESLAVACVDDDDCPSGVQCLSGTCRTIAPLPNGPFQGLNAQQDTIEIALRAEHTATTQFACRTSQTMTLGKIAMFQFFVFSDSPITDWHPGPEMFARGRVHGNGTVCVGGGADLWMDRITAAGDVRHMNEADCFGAGQQPVKIANRDNADFDDNNDGDPTDPVAAHFTAFDADSRATALPNWATFAVSTWKGHLLDQAHGVPRLKLPIVGIPETQQGVDAANAATAATKNGDTSRVLVDPVRVGVDTSEVRAQKFAAKADIRIINGIWFVKNVENEGQWPGIPIWSDHKGSYDAHDEFASTCKDLEVGNNPVADRKAGQSDLLVDRAWGARVPRRFSYYAARPDADELLIEAIGRVNQPAAVISYGVLARSGAGHTSVWAPGARSLFQQTGTDDRYSLCGLAPVPPTPPDPFRSTVLPALGMPCEPGAAAVKFIKADGVTVADDVEDIAASALIAGTRSGFRDGHADVAFDDDVQQSTSTDDFGRANVLPTNFDVAAFQLALADATQGELGSYFCPTPGVCACSGQRGCFGRAFNGIVWIGSTYDGSETGYPNGAPANLPAQGRITDAAQPFREDNVVVAGADGGNWVDNGVNYRLLTARAGRVQASPGCDLADADSCMGDEQSALPYPLCGGSGSFDSNDLFPRVSCTAGTTSRPNAIRLINARNLNMEIAANAPDIGAPAVFNPATVALPAGLTLISNLPVYVVGDVNLASDPEGGFPAVVAPNDLTATTWWPLLIGGDVVHLLSNEWDDRRSRWGLSTGNLRYLGHVTAAGVQVNPGPAADADPRVASETFYYMEILGGWGSTVDVANTSGGLENFPRFLEKWDTIRARFRGAFVVGHSKVYSRFKRHCCDARSYEVPVRDWGFDPTLADLRKQPPGAPVYDVAAVQQWSRN